MPTRRPSPPNPTTVFFVRHGQTATTGKVLPGRAPGLHLSDVGRQQADSVAERIGAVTDGGDTVAAIYASPLERTRETAAPIAKRVGVKVAVERDLLECDFGDWTGKQLKALMKKPEWHTVQRYPTGFRFPRGESFPEMQARIERAVDKMRARHPGRIVIAVSHADPIKAVVAAAMGTPLDLFQRIVVSPCSVTVIVFGVGGPTVLAVNAVGALTDLKPS